MTRSRLLGALLFAGLAAVAPALAADPPPPAATKAVKAAPWAATSTKTPASLDDLRALEAAVKTVVEKCTPATVGIRVPMKNKKGATTGEAAGSGVIVSADGLVLTAAHVCITPGHDCTLILADGKTVKAKALGTNARIDSGMMKILDAAPKGGWPHVEVGKSGALKLDQWVVTLGHHGGWRAGRPAVARLGQLTATQKDYLRTSCMIVGGDSGGPLFDLDGKLVGIHSRIGFSQEENIHVPTDGFKAEWAQLVAGEAIGATPKKTGATFGVSFEDADGKEVRGAKGVKLFVVVEDGPAAKAGMMVGDEIAAFDGTSVEAADDIRRLIARRTPGDEVEVIYYRGAARRVAAVTLGRRP